MKRESSRVGGLAGLALCALAVGCSSTGGNDGSGFKDGPLASIGDEDFTRVRVFYGTDRARTGSDQPGEFYGGGRGSLEVGFCDVSIPLDHQVGELEEPSFWTRWLSGEDPERHVVLLQVAPGDPEHVFASLKRRVESASSREAFVFVHGYNVTFEDAARRTAQVAYDVKFPGAPIFYSWPSQGSTAGYTKDETNVAWSRPHFRRFLLDVVERTGAERIHLVAHSMGNRLLTDVAVQLAAEGYGGAIFQEIILTAPDIDAEIFRRDIAPKLRGFGKRRTLYVSSGDLALEASRAIHGYHRAGFPQLDEPFPEGVSVIDASGVDTSLVGHSYYGDVSSVIADLYRVLRSEPVEERFWLVRQTTPHGTYWRFRD